MYTPNDALEETVNLNVVIHRPIHSPVYLVRSVPGINQFPCTPNRSIYTRAYVVSLIFRLYQLKIADMNNET